MDLENKTEYTLYELDKNEEIQKQIMELIPEIRKYYSFNGIKAVGEPNKIKRPWLSINIGIKMINFIEIIIYLLLNMLMERKYLFEWENVKKDINLLT